ncbi:unnamed protein product [Medioppia subpectinata]|uniref:Nuclear receptor domain-containing protein n=1 Tax=Medioppia subpectinata TaxID=1979941 RepID=A0A7R9KN86_9ACAR|nr:unnamed protein product [Medioppia subpectinata]CAG2106704.1 unnamed protein product [Medioppia subpectinata]
MISLKDLDVMSELQRSNGNVNNPPKKFVCILDDNCLISVKTRTECQKCRIEKCFTMGMKKSDNSQSNSISNSITSSSGLTSLSDESQEDIWELIDDIIDCNTDSSDDVFAHELIEINKTDTELVPISKPLTDYNGLKQLEFHRISEVINASTAFMSPLPKNIYQIENLPKFANRLIQMAENDIQNVINFTTSITGFGNMCPEDRYSRLLSAIVLFNPNRPNLIHRDIIRLEQQLYIYLLERYLLLKYGSEWESQPKVQKLMNSMKDLEIMTEIQRTPEAIDPMKKAVDLYGPLCIDLYDLKL